MIALSCAANADADKVFKYKDLILEKIETGTVITHVSGVKTLINLAKNRKYYDELKPILFKLQIECRPIDFAKRTEDMMHVIPANDISGYVDILKSGKQNLSAAGAKRTERVIKKLTLKSNS